jgi:hypothetical protein
VTSEQLVDWIKFSRGSGFYVKLMVIPILYLLRVGGRTCSVFRLIMDCDVDQDIGMCLICERTNWYVLDRYGWSNSF